MLPLRFPDLRARSARLTLALLGAAALAAPAGWWLSQVAAVEDATQRAASVDVVLPGRLEPDGSAPATPGEAPLAATDVALTDLRASEGMDLVERRPLQVTAPESALGVTLRGRLLSPDPNMAGPVLIRAVGPDERIVDELGLIGGPFALHGLERGTWTIQLRGASILESHVTLEVERRDGAIERDLMVEPAPSLPVLFFTSWGERLESALADPDRDDAAMPLVEVLRPEARSPQAAVLPQVRPGRYVGAMLGPGGELPPASGWIELLAPLPVEVRVVQAGREIERRRVTDLESPLHFVVDPLEEGGLPVLTGLLVERGSGAPVTDAIVELFPAGGTAPVRSRRVGPGGQLSMAGIGQGSWVLSIWSAGKAHRLQPLELEAPVDYALGLVELAPSQILGGRLLGPDGRALGNRSLRWVEGDGTARLASGYGRQGTRTDSGGTFMLRGVPTGELAVIAGGDEFAAQAFPCRVAAQGEELELRLQPGQPVHLAVTGDVEEALELSIRDAQDAVVHLRRVVSGRSQRVVLAPGRYTAAIHDGAVELASTTLDVGAEPLDVVLAVTGR